MFDIDGTLTASSRIDSDCYVQAMSEHLDVAIDDEWSRYRHVTDSGIAAELFARHGRPLGELPTVRQRFIDLLKQSLLTVPGCCEAVPGAAAFLARVRRTPGWTIGLATGGWSESAQAKLRHAGLDVEGFAFASADDAEARIDIMKVCLGRAKGNTKIITEVVYVGDGAWDADASAKLGWRFVGIGERIRAVRLREVATYAVFPDFTDPDAILCAAGAG